MREKEALATVVVKLVVEVTLPDRWSQTDSMATIRVAAERAAIGGIRKVLQEAIGTRSKYSVRSAEATVVMASVEP